MNFSYELIEKYKNFMGYSQDKQVISDFEEFNSGNMSQIKKGKRHLTANQCITMANAIGLDQKEALLNLAIEKSKSKEEGDIWTDIVKKISAACVALTLVAGLANAPTEDAFA
ncbi:MULTISPECIES: DUF3693 domain-containing protein [unclassified Pseudoalteromonas]|uniref:DUF3693 domain-containing protein n=1 Tax=unclassified Pseudoalteromonas TaxID=194690 RepID=UPI000EE5A325|nr:MULTISPECIES: DUF3693 domain-containing protein [unclassified Pseudoalteromonas]HAG39829.1 hypothetical protein [Pseudoalteromonas sp.]|tara:strand:+ start:42304 stop:42642 length:339 start_codon:yes stop_codon:yes gene_type:complete